MTVLFGARTYLCKFQFVYLLSKADKHILKQECNIRIPKINVKCLIFFMF